MRSLLQFLGSASSALCIALLSGALISSSARADDDPITVALPSCGNCYTCSAQNMVCQKSGSVRGCADHTYTCNCQSNGSGGYQCVSQ